MGVVLSCIKKIGLRDWPGRKEWCGLEEVGFARWGLIFTLGYLDIKEIPISLRKRRYFNERSQKYCIKVLFVLSTTDEIIFVEVFGGKKTDTECLQKSKFGRELVKRGGGTCNCPAKCMTGTQTRRDKRPSPYFWQTENSG